MPNLKRTQIGLKMAAHQKKDIRVIGRAVEFQPPSAPGLGIELGDAINPTGLVVTVVGRNAIVIVLGIHDPGSAHLLEIVQTIDALSFGLGSVQGWQKHGRKNGDDGDDYQQLDQCECSSEGEIQAWFCRS